MNFRALPFIKKNMGIELLPPPLTLLEFPTDFRAISVSPFRVIIVSTGLKIIHYGAGKLAGFVLWPWTSENFITDPTQAQDSLPSISLAIG